MRFWLKRRVHRVEETNRFLAWKRGSSKRRAAAAEAVSTRIYNMIAAMENATITIVRGLSEEQIRDFAIRTHGGNYGGDPGPFVWSKRTARNCIRHCLTNYEELWALCNRSDTGREAYDVLRERVEELIDEAYPQLANEREAVVSTEVRDA
jgi:hypothetical protein